MKENLRRSYYTKQFGIICLIIYTLLIVLSFFWIRDLQITGKYSESMLPDDHPYVVENNKWYETFPVENAVVLSIDTDSEAFSTENLLRIRTMTEELQESSFISAVYSITQLANTNESIFTTEPLLDIYNDDSIKKALTSIDDIQILRSLFLSADGQALLLYVIPEADVESDQIGLYLDAFKSRWQKDDYSIAISGLLYHEYQNHENIITDLRNISLLGLLLLGLIYYFFIRSISIAALLLINSFIPSLIMFGLLSLTNTPIDLMTVLLPLLLFSISTAYSIHYCKTYQVIGKRIETLSTVGIIILLSALTTMLGYSNLLFLNSHSMKVLGISLSVGIFLSVFSVLFCLPIILEHCTFRQFSSWELRLHATPYPAGKSRSILLTSYFVGLLIVVCGLYWYTDTWHYKEGYHQDWRSFVPMEREATLFAEHNGRIQNMDIFIDTGKEYGLVDTETYAHIAEMTQSIRDLNAVTTIISYTDITSYGNGILYGLHQEVSPASEEEIGETLELITAYREDLPLQLFVDQGYEKTRLLITFDDSTTSDSHEKVLMYLEILDIIEQTVAEMEGASYHAAGRPLLMKALNNFFLTFLSKAAPLFFLSIFLFGLLTLKSLKKSILLTIPTLFACFLYIGLNAWFKQPISVFNLFGLYTLMGISVDDSFYFLLNLNRSELQGMHQNNYHLVSNVYHTTGVNIIETTLIVTGGLLAALVSGTLPIARTIILVIFTLHFSTLSTLFIMPQFLIHSKESSKRKREDLIQ